MSEVKDNLGGLEAALLQLAELSNNSSTTYEGLAEYPSILDEPEDLLDLEWSDDILNEKSGRTPYQSVHMERLAQAFVVEDGLGNETSRQVSSREHGTETETFHRPSITRVQTISLAVLQSPASGLAGPEDRVEEHKATCEPFQRLADPTLAREGSSHPGTVSTDRETIARSEVGPVERSSQSNLSLVSVPLSSVEPFRINYEPNGSQTAASCRSTLLETPMSQVPPEHVEVPTSMIVSEVDDLDIPSTRSLLVSVTKGEIHQILHRPLHYAIESGNMSLLKVLLDEGSDVNKDVDKTNQPPLALAVDCKSERATGILLGCGADFCSIRPSGKATTLLEEAVTCFSPKVLDYVNLDDARNELSTSSGRTLLRAAQKSGSWDIMYSLVLCAASETPVAEILDQEETLWWAIQSSDKAATEFILQKGANPNTKHALKQLAWERPIHIASRGPAFDLVEVLISHGANILDQDSLGCAPLYYAVLSGDCTVIEKHFDAMVKAVKSREPKAKLLSALETEVSLAVTGACFKGDVEKLILVLKLSGEQIGRHTRPRMLYYSVRYARSEVTKYLLRSGFDPRLPFRGKLADEAPFCALKGSDLLPENDISDYEVCKALVREARENMRVLETPKNELRSEVPQKSPRRRMFFSRTTKASS